MNLVIDTNVMLVSIGINSPTIQITRSLIDGSHCLCVTNDIVNEYEEVLSKKLGSNNANLFIDLILNLPSTKLINPYYHWNLIKQDPDDNKFVDCAIAANAEYIVTEDKHFEILKKIDFPVVNIITAQKFIESYLKP